jgi:hypothetical protein
MRMYRITFGNSCRQSRFTMIYMTNSSYVAMWFITIVYLFISCVESLTSKGWQEQLTIQSMMMLLIRHNLQQNT